MTDKPPTVRDILRDWLKANGYDGLYHDVDCACLIDDLAPCGGDCMGCHVGYKHPCRPEDCQECIDTVGGCSCGYEPGMFVVTGVRQ